MTSKASARPTAFAAILLLALGAFVAAASSGQPAGTQAPAARSDAFDTTIKPFLQTYCYGCHRGSQPAGSFDLTVYDSADSVLNDPRHWNLVSTRLKGGEMPPSQSRNQPDAAQRQAVVDWIGAVTADDARRHPND